MRRVLGVGGMISYGKKNELGRDFRIEDGDHYRVGDGEWFYANPATPKVSRVRSVIPDPLGNLIIVESNCGYVRRTRFQRMAL